MVIYALEHTCSLWSRQACLILRNFEWIKFMVATSIVDISSILHNFYQNGKIINHRLERGTSESLSSCTRFATFRRKLHILVTATTNTLIAEVDSYVRNLLIYGDSACIILFRFELFE